MNPVRDYSCDIINVYQVTSEALLLPISNGMKKYLKRIWADNPKIRKTVGVILVVIGLISIITPLTPVGFLLVIGLEILGIRVLLWDKIKNWLTKF